MVRVASVLAAVALVMESRPAQAQATVGVGPRMAFVRGDANAETASRYSGGALRARLSDKTALELALDYRSLVNDSLTERVRDFPIQGSVLLFPIRASFSPYFLGGIGWYAQRVEKLAKDAVVTATTTRKIGYHAGLGGELRMGKRVGVHADYRYTFIRFGAVGATPTRMGAIPVPGTLTFQDRLKLSHEGSMWTGGLTFYF